MNGLHLTADLRQCNNTLLAMTQSDALRVLCLSAVERAGLQAVGELFHRFGPSPVVQAQGLPQGGVTGVVLLAESHLAVHTWPELSAVTLDVYVCNIGADNGDLAHQVLNELIAVFAPQQVERHVLQRGVPDNKLERLA
ncbi:MAG: S-adenosylmethionine decarboxylase proenzyme [Rhizobacter sp.]